MEQLEAIRNAAQLLAVRAGDSGERLLKAGDVIWSAMYATTDWPEPLRERIEGLSRRLMARGTVEATLERMDESACRNVSAEILEIAELVDAHVHAPV